MRPSNVSVLVDRKLQVPLKLFEAGPPLKYTRACRQEWTPTFGHYRILLYILWETHCFVRSKILQLCILKVWTQHPDLKSPFIIEEADGSKASSIHLAVTLKRKKCRLHCWNGWYCHFTRSLLSNHSLPLEVQGNKVGIGIDVEDKCAYLCVVCWWSTNDRSGSHRLRLMFSIVTSTLPEGFLLY